jgi:acyl-CoA reductase-like NAD-dependent aldehyde dehydrogenase
MGSQKESLSSVLIPLATSIAAGNYNLLVPQTLETGETSAVKKFTMEIISQLDQERVRVVFGKSESFDLAGFLRSYKVDMIFSTRSGERSMIDYEAACECDVEFKSHSLGWSIGMVDQFADLDYAAKLIVQKKFYKSGQDVNNLDTVFVHKNVSKAFLTMVKDYLYQFYAKKGGENLEYGKMFDSTNFARVTSLVKRSDHAGELKTRFQSNEQNLTINPVIITNPKISSTLMEKKILGPVLPIIEYTDAREVQAVINSRDNVENLFYFTKNSGTVDLVERMYKFKNLYFNDTNVPISSGHVRKSGIFSIGNNELIGKYGIRTFSKQTLFYDGWNFKQGFIQGLTKNPVVKRLSRNQYVGLWTGFAGYLGYRYLF